MIWELVFMLVILKIPVVYLCAVVWWAVKAEPQPLEGAGVVGVLGPDPGCDWQTRRARALRRGPVPRGGRPARKPGRVAYARARVTT
ncbi:MAG TPA: hypothetical protein VM049_04345 [Gaiellaceae bacterium]|nr:hypothetical protein [Gaiellaceae bacterium]